MIVFVDPNTGLDCDGIPGALEPVKVFNEESEDMAGVNDVEFKDIRFGWIYSRWLFESLNAHRNRSGGFEYFLEALIEGYCGAVLT